MCKIEKKHVFSCKIDKNYASTDIDALRQKLKLRSFIYLNMTFKKLNII